MLLLMYGIHLLSERQLLRTLTTDYLQKANSVLNYVAVAKRTSKQAKIHGEKSPGSGT